MQRPRGIELIATGSTPGGNPDHVHRLTSESISTKALTSPSYLTRRIELLAAVGDEEANRRGLTFENVLVGAREGWDKPTKEELYRLTRLIRSELRKYVHVKLIVHAGPRRIEHLREQSIRNASTHRLHPRPGPSPNTIVFL